MRNDESSASFLSRWMRARRAPVEDDPAGLGTAFGLDLSMAQGVPEPAELCGASSVPEAVSSSGWLTRLRRRAA